MQSKMPWAFLSVFDAIYIGTFMSSITPSGGYGADPGTAFLFINLDCLYNLLHWEGNYTEYWGLP